MIFGIQEIYEYKKTCTDPKVLEIIKRMEDARRMNALWCSKVNELEEENKKLEKELKYLRKWQKELSRLVILDI